jgi:hypothetical protein
MGAGSRFDRRRRTGDSVHSQIRPGHSIGAASNGLEVQTATVLRVLNRLYTAQGIDE